MKKNDIVNILRCNLYDHNIAIITSNECITYRQLRIRVEHAVACFGQNGISARSIVCLCMNRTCELIVAALAAMEIGAPLLVLPRNFPIERINFMIKDCRANFYIENGRKGEFLITCIGHEVNSKAENAALILYTSGSTGTPKGVVIGKMALSHYFKVAIETLEYNNTHIHLAAAPFSFDLHINEIYLPLILGKTVVLANDIESKNPRSLAKLIDEYAIDTISMTPSKMLWLLDANRSKSFINNTRKIILGGEHLRSTLVDKIRSLSKCKIYNIYGPTESTVFVTYKEIHESQDISLGKPIEGVVIFICDDVLNILPPNSVGEICISGSTLAEGYIGKDSLTKERFFIRNDGNRIYRTGDYGYINDNAELFLNGRRDRQIKIYGCRIELDEIENVIIKYKDINNCIVTFNEKDSTINVIYESSKEIDKTLLIEFILSFLPSYMIPKSFKRISNFIYTQNGKIDRRFYYEPY